MAAVGPDKIVFIGTTEGFGDGLQLTDRELSPFQLGVEVGGRLAQAAGKLRGLGFKSPVLFLTALKDYVFDAFDVDAVNYLVKPVDKKKLFLSLQKALEGEQAGLLIKRGYDYRKILVSDILYFESAGRKVAVHTAGETLEYYQKIRELPARLGRSFYMPHRSFLVNLSHVKALDGNDVLMDNGDRLPIAKGKKEGLTACLLRHFRGETDA